MNESLRNIMNLIDKNSDCIPESDYVDMCNELKLVWNTLKINKQKHIKIFGYEGGENIICEESVNLISKYNHQVTRCIVCDELYKQYLEDLHIYHETGNIQEEEYIERCVMLYAVDNSLSLNNYDFTTLNSKYEINVESQNEFLKIMFPKLKRMYEIMMQDSINNCDTYWNELSSTVGFEALLELIQDTKKNIHWLNEYYKIIENIPRYLESIEIVNGYTVQHNYTHIVPEESYL